MADLKADQRQIGQPSAPNISSAGAAFQGTANVVGGIAKAVGASVEKKRKAALQMEALYNTLTAQREMGLGLSKFKNTPNVTPEDFEQLNQTNQKLAQEILKNTSEENKAKVTKSLLKSAISTERQAFDYLGASTERQTKEAGSAALYEAGKRLYETARNGQEEEFTSLYEEVNQGQQALVEAGYLSPEQAAKNKDDLLQIGINAKLQHDYEKAIENDGERGGAKFIENFWNANLNMSEQQKEKALQSLVTLRTQNLQASKQIGQAGYRDVMELVTSPAAPKTEAELDIAIAQSAERGYPLNEYQAYKAKQSWRTKQKSANSRAEKNAEITQLNATGNVNALLDVSDKDIDNWYTDTKRFVAEKNAEEAQEAQSLSGQVYANRPEWMVGAAIAAQTQVPISKWQDELHSKLLSNNDEDILNAISAFNYVAKQNKRAIDGFPAKDKAFIDSITNDLENTSLSPQEIIEKYKESILNVDPKVQENRVAAYKEYIKNNPNEANKIVSGAFGKKIANPLKQPSAELYAAAQNAFEREYSLTGNATQARKNAISYLEDNGGVSKFGPKNEPVWNPPENLPFYDFGNIVRNQATKYLKDAVSESKKHPGKLPYSIEWSKKMPDFPEQVSQEDLFKKEYDKGEWWLNINGEDRRVYFISPNYNQANSFAETRYQVMYEKDGYLHNLLTVGPSVGLDGKLQMSANASLMTFVGPEELTPNLIRKMQAEQAQEAKDKYVTKEVYSEVSKDLSEGFSRGRGFIPDPPGERVEREKAKRDKALKIIDEKNKDLPKRIEKEKLRRQQALTKKLIEGNQND